MDEQICPIMKQCGFQEKLCLCDRIPEREKQLGASKPCYIGNQCQVEKRVRTTQSYSSGFRATAYV
jgi:hypothetical protein